MVEIWKDVEGFDDYEISNLGRIKSYKQKKEGKILNPWKTVKNYLMIAMSLNGKKYNKSIHRLVLENFHPIENMDQFECNHINGIKSDNRYPENIEWCNRSENMKHAYNTGLKKPTKHSDKTKQKISEKLKGRYLNDNHPFYGKKHLKESRKKMSINHANVKGENNCNSKLKKYQVVKIKILLSRGDLKHKEIAKMFGGKSSNNI